MYLKILFTISTLAILGSSTARAELTVALARNLDEAVAIAEVKQICSLPDQENGLPAGEVVYGPACTQAPQFFEGSVCRATCMRITKLGKHADEFPAGYLPGAIYAAWNRSKEEVIPLLGYFRSEAGRQAPGYGVGTLAGKPVCIDIHSQQWGNGTYCSQPCIRPPL